MIFYSLYRFTKSIQHVLDMIEYHYRGRPVWSAWAFANFLRHHCLCRLMHFGFSLRSCSVGTCNPTQMVGKGHFWRGYLIAGSSNLSFLRPFQKTCRSGCSLRSLGGSWRSDHDPKKLHQVFLMDMVVNYVMFGPQILRSTQVVKNCSYIPKSKCRLQHWNIFEWDVPQSRGAKWNQCKLSFTEDERGRNTCIKACVNKGCFFALICVANLHECTLFVSISAQVFSCEHWFSGQHQPLNSESSMWNKIDKSNRTYGRFIKVVQRFGTKQTNKLFSLLRLSLRCFSLVAERWP